MTSSAVADGPSILIGRCSGCGHAFRAEVPAGRPVFAGYATLAAGANGFPIRHDCRTGVRCPESPEGLPACGDWDCEGHDFTEVNYKALKITYKPGAVCKPGSCHEARTSKCTCSCRGKNHGLLWKVGRI